MDFEYADGGGRIGIIASVTRPFCKNCNRLRLTADGKFRNCLFALDEVDMRPALQLGNEPEMIRAIVRDCVSKKWEGHEINSARFIKPTRTMHTIGG
jgi:cyclic pyranopterin phosphate synthase